jgi:GNAT superfamily N-acetyltransferase
MQFRLATRQDVASVAGVLSAAAADLRRRDLTLWSIAEVSETTVEPHINSGLYHVGLQGARVVGVFRLQTRDPSFWPEIPEGTSAYLHKLAVLPEGRGQGLAHLLLRHAAEVTHEKGFGFLRLDCMGGRPKLRAVYESFGFRHHSQIVLGGQMFERFELKVGASNV